MERDRKIIVLGGGLAGLAASVASGATVYEAADQPGGVACSDRFDGFTFDRGIHILQTTNQELLEWLRELGVQFREHRRNAYIYSHETYTAYPFQVNTSGLPVSLRARCVWQYLARNRSLKPRNYEEWMYRTLGKGFARTFLIPYSEKFWTVPPSEMTFEWTGKRVPQPSLVQVLRGAMWSKQTRIGTNTDFRYPLGEAGYGEVASALARKVQDLRLGWRAVEWNADARKVAFSNGKSVGYNTMVSTIPLPVLVSICPQAPMEVREAAAKLRTNRILVVNLGFDRAEISDRHWIHFPEKDVSFFRISYPHNFSADVAPKGRSSVSAEVAYGQNEQVDPEKMTDRVIRDLIRVGAIRETDRVISRGTHNIRFAYCVYDKNRTEALRTIHSWVRGHGVIPAGRYGLWTYFWSDESILSGRKAGLSAIGRTSGQEVCDSQPS